MTTILIADDDADTRETLQLLLEDEGYPTLIAADGEQALTILRSVQQPLVAVLDISLPRLDGLSILRIAAQGDIRGRRAYILCTGHSPAMYVPFADVLSDLHTAVLPKPFDVDNFLLAIKRSTTTLTASS